jgi:phosphohistidine phosphatase
MQLYLLRHGVAEDGYGIRDAERNLTLDGISKLESMLAAARSSVQPDLILTSPYARAIQTADLVKKILRVEAQIIESKAFTPDSDPVEAWNELRIYREYESVLVASHNPLCGALLAFLLNSPALIVDFKKGMMAHVQLHQFTAQPHGVLQFLFPTRLAR